MFCVEILYVNQHLLRYPTFYSSAMTAEQTPSIDERHMMWENAGKQPVVKPFVSNVW